VPAVIAPDRTKKRRMLIRVIALFVLALASNACHSSRAPSPAVATDDRSTAPPAASPAEARTPGAMPPGPASPPQAEVRPSPPAHEVAPSFDAAIVRATDALLNKAMAASPELSSPPPRLLLIDPLVDGLTATRSVATVSMQRRIAEHIRAHYPQFELQPFSTENLAAEPLVLIGTLTAINRQGEPQEPRELTRVWLTLLDLKSGKVIAKAQTRARREGIDITPTRYFGDSPTWALDRAMRGYVDACQKSKVGDPINQDYLDQIQSSALISDAIAAYEAGRYSESLRLYQRARAMPAGDQLRVYNGLYLANLKLGDSGAATEAIDDIIDFGLRTGQLSVKFLFQKGSTLFWADPAVSGPYREWLRSIAALTSASTNCLVVKGHASRTGPEPLNERLSLLRAEYIERRLVRLAPSLETRMIATGVGSTENLVGTGTDDALDALDRRVEFDVIGC
jgi:outer membrane protein OmpA-like peptidoglycan-associated protein